MAVRFQAGQRNDRPVGELISDLASQTGELVRQEFELAKAELSEKGKIVAQGASLLGSAAVIGLGAFGALTTCAIAALATGMDLWLAALIVGVVYALIASALALAGKQRTQRAMPPAPEQAIESTKEDIRWAKNQTKSART